MNRQLTRNHPALRWMSSILLCATSAASAAPLNDTGITRYGNADSNTLTEELADYPGQDAGSGRDAAAAAGMLDKTGGGSAGFDFTKLDAGGQPLPAGAAAWQCVKDNVTGLIWEVKTDDSGLHDKDWTYTWRNPDSNSNGGNAGTENGGSCQGGSCDTQGFADLVNAQGWCGANDWRLPDVDELLSIVDNSRVNPAIDIVYFPRTKSSSFWSSSPFAGYSSLACYVYVNYGNVYDGSKGGARSVRLVRGGQ